MERSGGASLLGQDRPVESTPALEAIWTKLGVCLDLRSFRLGKINLCQRLVAFAGFRRFFPELYLVGKVS